MLYYLLWLFYTQKVGPDNFQQFQKILILSQRITICHPLRECVADSERGIWAIVYCPKLITLRDNTHLPKFLFLKIHSNIKKQQLL